MSLINIANVEVLNNPSGFYDLFQFEVTFECLQELQDDIEWKVIYVGNAEDSSGDQVLEEVMVGPVSLGINRFVLQAEAPKPHLIANNDLIGVTVILITCSYMDNKFVQIGYYVNNEYSDPFEPENFPNPVDLSKITRNILSGEPRVTRFAIHWTGDGLPPMNDEDQKRAGEMVNEELVDLENDREEEGDDEDDDEDEDGEEIEVDIDDEEDEEGDGEDIEIEGTGSEAEDLEGMEVLNDDSNSMDIGRMLQRH